MIFLELLFGIPIAIALIAFVVVMTAFLYPRFARWLEARTVPRWPRTKGWFYDETSELDEPVRMPASPSDEATGPEPPAADA